MMMTMRRKRFVRAERALFRSAKPLTLFVIFFISIFLFQVTPGSTHHVPGSVLWPG